MNGIDITREKPAQTARRGVIDLMQPLCMYYFVFAIFLAGFWVIYRTIHSPFGQVLKAIRENEPRAISLGYLSLILPTKAKGLPGEDTVPEGFRFQPDDRSRMDHQGRHTPISHDSADGG